MNTENQVASCILMIQPLNFASNSETLTSNAFQLKAAELSPQNIQTKALDEFTKMVSTLRQEEVEVIVIEDTPEQNRPDAIFPNNWFSTHCNGDIVLYPMEANNRRNERRLGIFDTIISTYKFSVKKIINLSYYESQKKYLEGTGSLVLDRTNKFAYMCKSTRSHSDVLATFCETLGYSPIEFTAVDEQGTPPPPYFSIW